MDLYAVLDQIVALLQRRGRVTYNALKLRCTLGKGCPSITRSSVVRWRLCMVKTGEGPVGWPVAAGVTMTPSLSNAAGGGAAERSTA